MYQYIFDEDTTKKIKDKTEKSNNIFEQFSEVDNKYSTLTNANNSLELEQMEFTKPTVDEVKTKAENSLQDYKMSNINSINETFDTKVNQINKDVEQVKQNSKRETDELKNSYNMAKENASNDAIKRGLARSSIIVNTLANYDNSLINKLEAQANELTGKLQEFESEKNLLEQQKQNALNSFDISYAVKLQEKINGINENIKAEEDAVIKYNNEIAELKAKWEKEQENNNFDKTTELAKLVGEYGSTVFDVLKQNEKYALAQDHFKNLSKEDALSELQNNSAYVTNLGKINYNKLLEELKARD